VQRDELLGMWKRQGTQQHAVDDGEDAGHLRIIRSAKRTSSTRSRTTFCFGAPRFTVSI
jgi:hypothetical protein